MNLKEVQERTLEEVCQEHRLEEGESKKISEIINGIMLEGKIPQKKPVAIIDLAPPGSGKTGLNGMGVSQFPKDNVVVINSDELKPFHPKNDEIAKLYPKYYTKVTNQESNTWTDNLFYSAINSNYNIIFEGTGRNIKLLSKMISKMENYKIIVRAMAVNELNCLMSIIERYEGQVSEKGWGRLVTLEHFYKAYTEMLDTIQQIEKINEIDLLEVYIRGKKPTKPIRIYSSDSKEFLNAKLAIMSGRDIDFENAKKYYQNTFKKRLAISSQFSEEIEILDEINSLTQVKEKEFEW